MSDEERDVWPNGGETAAWTVVWEAIASNGSSGHSRTGSLAGKTASCGCCCAHWPAKLQVGAGTPARALGLEPNAQACESERLLLALAALPRCPSSTPTAARVLACHGSEVALVCGITLPVKRTGCSLPEASTAADIGTGEQLLK